MNAEIFLSSRSWAYRVRIGRCPTGYLYAHLVGAEGKVGAILGTRLTRIDDLVNDGRALYAELLKRLADTLRPATANPNKTPCLPRKKN